MRLAPKKKIIYCDLFGPKNKCGKISKIQAIEKKNLEAEKAIGFNYWAQIAAFEYLWTVLLLFTHCNFWKWQNAFESYITNFRSMAFRNFYHLHCCRPLCLHLCFELRKCRNVVYSCTYVCKHSRRRFVCNVDCLTWWNRTIENHQSMIRK